MLLQAVAQVSVIGQKCKDVRLSREVHLGERARIHPGQELLVGNVLLQLEIGGALEALLGDLRLADAVHAELPDRLAAVTRGDHGPEAHGVGHALGIDQPLLGIGLLGLLTPDAQGNAVGGVTVSSASLCG